MYSVLADSYFNDQDGHQLHIISQQFIKRYDSLAKIQSFSHETSPDMIKMFLRIIKHQLDAQNFRHQKENLLLEALRHCKLTKKIKKQLTQFSFNTIHQLAPFLDVGFEKHYTNIIKLFELFFSSLEKNEYLKKIHILKSNNIIFKMELYVSLIELLINHCHNYVVNRLNQISRVLNTTKRNKAGDIFFIKTQITKQRQKQLRQLKETKIIKQKHKRKLPSLNYGLLFDKFKFVNLSFHKLNTSNFQIMGSKPAYRYSMQIEQKQALKVKNRTELSMQLSQSPLKIKSKQLTNVKKHQSFKAINNIQKTIKAKSQINQQLNIKPSKRIIFIRTLQSRQDFLQQFSQNILGLHKSTQLNDLQQNSKGERLHRYSKLDWLGINQNRLVQLLIQKNISISKQITNYATKHSKLTE